MSRQPDGDLWIVTDVDPNSQNYGMKYKADFTYIKNAGIKSIFKEYIWENYITGNRATLSIIAEIGKFKKFINFAYINGIDSLRELSNEKVTRFVSYLHTNPSEITGTAYSYAYQKNCLDTLKSVVHWCQIHNPEAVPETEIFTGNEYKGLTHGIRIEFIPDDIIYQINLAIKNESNLYLKYGIYILETTGMRIGDLMKLKVDCLQPHPVGGYTIKWYDHKNRKEHPPLPIPEKCSNAVNQLIINTGSIRTEANYEIKNSLFIYRSKSSSSNKKIKEIPIHTFTTWINNFINDNQIVDSYGNPYSLSTHKFRRTLATDMFSKGVSLKVIQQVLGHSSPLVTRRHYSDVKDKERKEMFDRIGIIGDISRVDANTIPDSSELNWFMDNKNTRARMCDGYCTKPFDNQQICERLLSHKKCYTCSRYITTPEFIEVHKNYLNDLETQLSQNIYGEHYATHFKPVIKILKDIICRLETLQNER
jgi:integrase